jgi:transcriptional regulator with XRE-family HTH domain
MTRHSRLLETPPYAVERALKALGTNLRTARVRRKLTLENLAQRVGVSRRILSDVERGKPSTGIGIYVAALWALGLLDHLSPVADPTKDAEGLALTLARQRSRVRKTEVLDNDF